MLCNTIQRWFTALESSSSVAVLQRAYLEHCFEYSTYSIWLDIAMYAAADDDDDDLFAEFDVDMDMDGEPAPLAKPSTSISEEADNMHMEVDRDTATPAADATPEDTSLPVNTKTDDQALSGVSHDAADADLHNMPDKPPQSGNLRGPHGMIGPAGTCRFAQINIVSISEPMSHLQLQPRQCKLSRSGCAYAGFSADIAAIQPAEPAATVSTSADTETCEPAAVEDSDIAMPTRAENDACKGLPDQPADTLHAESALPSAPNALGTQQHEDVLQQREEQMLSSSYHQAQAEEQLPADHQDVPMQIEEEHAQLESDVATNQQHTGAAGGTPTSKTTMTEDAQHKTANQSDVDLPGAIITQHTGEASHMPGSCGQGVVQADITPEPAAQDDPLLVNQDVHQTVDAVPAEDSLMKTLPGATKPVPSEPPLAEETAAEQGTHQAEVSDMLQ